MIPVEAVAVDFLVESIDWSVDSGHGSWALVRTRRMVVGDNRSH
jgi:hypothetical protein